MRAIIHIGTCKTGTTTIQHFLRRNRESLKEQGVFIPLIHQGTHPDAQHALGAATYLPDTWESNPLFLFRGHCHYTNLVGNVCTSLEKGLMPQDQNKLWEAYCHEIKANCNKDDLVIFSTETLSFFLENEIERVKELMTSLFDDISIIIYLRCQPEFLISFYQTYTKNGGTWSIDDYLNMPEDWSVLAYDKMVMRWSIFGKDKIKIRIFDRQMFHENDLLSDFAATAGFTWMGLEQVKNQNVTKLDSAEIEVIRLLNFHIPALLDSGRNNPEHSYFVRNILCSKKDREKREVAYHLSQNEARQILKKYRKGNDWIAQEYLGKERLFDEELSTYPEKVLSGHQLTLERYSEIVSNCTQYHLVERNSRDAKIQLQLSEIKNRDAKIQQQLSEIKNRDVKIQQQLTEIKNRDAEIQRLLYRRNKRLLYRCKALLTWIKQNTMLKIGGIR